MSVWIDNPPEYYQQQQQQRATTTTMRSLSTSPARRRDGGGSFNGRVFGCLHDGANAADSSYGGGVMSHQNGPASPENRSPSPPTGLGRPSSILRRISDKGGGSLPGSPTRGGSRYGRTDQLVCALTVMMNCLV